MEEIKVSHACVVDENLRVFFDKNEILDWLSFLWWKHELHETDEVCIKRELLEEAWIKPTDIIKSVVVITDEILEIDWTKFNWTLRAIQISNELWDKIEKRSNIVRLEVSNILSNKDLFSHKLDFKWLLGKILASIFSLSWNKIWK